MQIIRNLPFFVRMALRNLFTFRGAISCVVRCKIIILLLMVILYILSPFDLIPESIYGIVGYIDDVIIVLLVFIIIARGAHQNIVGN